MNRTLARAAAACVGAPTPQGAARDALIRRIADVLAPQPAGRRWLLRAGLAVLEVLPLLRYGRVFSALDAPRAEATLRALARSRLAPFRRLARALKMTVQYAWYLAPEAQAETGDDGPWLGRFEIPVGPPPRLERP
ncbi:MAG TPA: hypothetical protein VEI02_13080 [Planctomycetota bacterium]|nr:hypothetical protein [Planctomycetota bacterium]